MSTRPFTAILLAVKTAQCSCGYLASGDTAEALLADVEAHIDSRHRPLRSPVEGPSAEAAGEAAARTAVVAGVREAAPVSGRRRHGPRGTGPGRTGKEST